MPFDMPLWVFLLILGLGCSCFITHALAVIAGGIDRFNMDQQERHDELISVIGTLLDKIELIDINVDALERTSRKTRLEIEDPELAMQIACDRAWSEASDESEETD